MRLRIGAVLAVGAMITGSLCGACEALSGLNNYSTGPDAADGTVPGPEAGDDATTSPPDDAPVVFGEDASSSGGGTDSGASRDAMGGWPDSGHHEAGEPCGPSNCSTCCAGDAGCVAANVNAACGTGGGACTDCASGKVCSGGTCIATTCNASACSAHGCVPVYGYACCKASGGCGCTIIYPPAPCM